ncbi:MAG: 50S ribosomal protein L10 [Patescibacteria group bacterium]|nr:50S ribosomal protein L10 [Patescibacteria group bacterium]
MAKTKKQKEEIIKKIEKELSKMKSLVFIDYYGLKVKEIDQLRKLLKEKSCQYLVTKKTLLDIVLKKLGLNINLDEIEGGAGLVFGFDSEVEPAKLVVKFAKEHEQLKIKGGIMEKNFIDSMMVETVAKLPGKQELIGQLLGTIKGPINGFVYALKANLKSLVYILSSIKN